MGTVSDTDTVCNPKSGRTGHLSEKGEILYATKMVTRIRKGAKPHLYIKEHMKLRGVSADQMAGWLDMTRESVYRSMREQNRIPFTAIPDWADAIGLEHWQDLLRPPAEPSIDARMDGIAPEIREAVSRLVKAS